MGLPHSSPRAAAPCSPRLTAWAMRSDPCNNTTQTHRETEGAEAPQSLVLLLLWTLLLLLLHCLPNLCSLPEGRQITTIRHLADGQKPSNLTLTYRSHTVSCRHQFTLIPRLTEASSRRANFTKMQTLGHLGHPDNLDPFQTDQQLRRRILDRIPSMTMTTRTHYNTPRLVARGVAETR